MRRFFLLSLIPLSALLYAGAPGVRSQVDAARPFAGFVDDYFDAFYSWKPSEGTAAGFHQYDRRLEDWSAAATAKRIETVKTLQGRLAKLRAGALMDEEKIDAEVLDG